MAPLEYFCYVSRNKVDQLYEQIDPEAGYEITESKLRETTVSADATIDWKVAHIFSLFKAGGSYGRKGVIQREAKVKKTYLQRLQIVLLALAEEAPIPPFAALPSEGEPSRAYCHLESSFCVDEPVEDAHLDDVITVRSHASARTVLLDCSLRNFSEGSSGPDGRLALNSSNVRFFKGDLHLPMTTIFLILELTPERVVGSPLFLKLSVDGRDRLTAL